MAPDGELAEWAVELTVDGVVYVIATTARGREDALDQLRAAALRETPIRYDLINDAGRVDLDWGTVEEWSTGRVVLHRTWGPAGPTTVRDS
jgi:hypothetical protein